MDFDDHSYTNVDEHRDDSAPRRTPRMLPAETVMPTVSYRGPVGPSATPRTVTPGAASPTPSAAMRTAAYRVPAPEAAAPSPRHTPPEGARALRTPTDGVRSIDAASELETMRRAQPTPPRPPIAAARHAAPGVELEAELSIVEMMPRAPRTPTPHPRAASPVELAPESLDTARRAQPTPPRAPIASVRHAAPAVECDPELSVVEMMPRAPRVTAAPAPIATTTPRGDLTVVFGCRGGAGSTTLAVNTAAALARAGRSVCIVDLDLQLGDVCVALDLDPQTSLAAVAREAHMLDGTSLRRRLAQHSSGICALTQTGHVDELDAGLSARLPTLLDTLRMHFDHVIVDGVRDFGDVALAALEAATRILVVVTQDVPAVRRAARVPNLLGRLAIDESRCALVINRAARRAAIDDAAIERALGIKIAARVREDAKVAEALDAGALLIDIARSRAIVEDVARVATLCKGGV